MNGYEAKLERLKGIIKDLGGVVVAFSGGVDSTFLVRVAVDVLGDRVLAVTAVSETYPVEEVEEAKELARALGVRHQVIYTEELSNLEFASNPPNRCYFCKKELFAKLWEVAKENGLESVVDGANLDDTGEHRPGLVAGRELGVRSPLRESGFTKEEIRKASRGLGLPTWNKPSLACLSSRFPYGQRITPEKLQQVGRAERFLKGLGISQVRVRYHGQVARIEVPRQEMGVVFENAEKVSAKLKALGFIYVALDLDGYRSGSMDEALTEDEKCLTSIPG